MISTKDKGTCACGGDEQRAAHDPAYRRALWIVGIVGMLRLSAIRAGSASADRRLPPIPIEFLCNGS